MLDWDVINIDIDTLKSHLYWILVANLCFEIVGNQLSAAERDFTWIFLPRKWQHWSHNYDW